MKSHDISNFPCRIKNMRITKVERFVIYPLLIASLVLFAFYDLNITHALYNPKSLFGRIGENLAEMPFQLLCVFACCLLFKYRDRSSKSHDIVWGIFFVALAIFFSGYSGGRFISYSKSYGWNKTLRWGVAVGISALHFAIGALCAHFAKADSPRKAVAFSLFVLIMWILSFLMMNGLKFLWHRPRWRYIVTLEGDPDQYFVPVYILGCNGGLSSDFASFPSGHTINAVGVISISLLGYVFPKFDKSSFLLRVFAYIWATLCAISRIILGAHFASDVAAGFLFGFLLFDLMSTFFYPFFMRKVDEFSLKGSV